MQEKELPDGTLWTSEMVEEQFSGTGVGRKTLAQICDEIGIDVDYVKERLLKGNIDIGPDQTMKNAADKYGVHSIDILKIILVANYKIR